jgi:hypothetical protein
MTKIPLTSHILKFNINFIRSIKHKEPLNAFPCTSKFHSPLYTFRTRWNVSESRSKGKTVNHVLRFDSPCHVLVYAFQSTKAIVMHNTQFLLHCRLTGCKWEREKFSWWKNSQPSLNPRAVCFLCQGTDASYFVAKLCIKCRARQAQKNY